MFLLLKCLLGFFSTPFHGKNVHRAIVFCPSPFLMARIGVFHSVLNFAILHCVMPFFTIPCCAEFFHAVLYCIVPELTVLFHDCAAL